MAVQFHRHVRGGTKKKGSYDHFKAIDEAIHYLGKNVGKLEPWTRLDDVPFSRAEIAQVVEETTGIPVVNTIMKVDTIGDLALRHTEGGDKVNF